MGLGCAEKEKSQWALGLGLEPNNNKTEIKCDKNIKIKYDKYGIKHNTKNKI